MNLLQKCKKTERVGGKHKTSQDLKVKAESIENTHDGNLEMKNIGTQTGTSEVSLTSRIQDLVDRVSRIEDKMKEWILWSEKMLNTKNKSCY